MVFEFVFKRMEEAGMELSGTPMKGKNGPGNQFGASNFKFIAFMLVFHGKVQGISCLLGATALKENRVKYKSIFLDQTYPVCQYVLPGYIAEYLNCNTIFTNYIQPCT